MDMSIYCTDDYPREGCTMTIRVTKYGYVTEISAPNGQVFESGGAKTPEGISNMVRNWCEGRAPRPGAREDQP